MIYEAIVAGCCVANINEKCFTNIVFVIMISFCSFHFSCAFKNLIIVIIISQCENVNRSLLRRWFFSLFSLHFRANARARCQSTFFFASSLPLLFASLILLKMKSYWTGHRVLTWSNLWFNRWSCVVDLNLAGSAVCVGAVPPITTSFKFLPFFYHSLCTKCVCV